MELEKFLKVDFDEPNGIVTITLDRQGESKSDKYNSMNRGLIESLQVLLESYQDDNAIRAVIITGRGNVFSTGADIEGELMDMDHKDAYLLSFRGQKTIQMLETAPFLTLAAINGFALGGGFELALACDFRIASSSARMGLPEINLGIQPGWGGTQRLTYSIGYQRAMELIISGDPINAALALELGIVREVVEPDDLLPAAHRFLSKLTKKSRFAVSIVKRSVHKSLQMGLNEGLECEAELFALQWASDARKEGIDAFLARRKPDFGKTG